MMTLTPNLLKLWCHILRTSPGSLGWFLQELIGLPSDRLDGESQLLVILEVAIRKLLHLKKWAGGIEMDFEKRAGGIERAGGFFENCPKKVVHAKKIFIWPISANLTVLNNCQYSQGSEKKDWGEIPGLLVELLISKVGHNSVGHTVYLATFRFTVKMFLRRLECIVKPRYKKAVKRLKEDILTQFLKLDARSTNYLTLYYWEL